jgi:hypothetical protein
MILLRRCFSRSKVRLQKESKEPDLNTLSFLSRSDLPARYNINSQRNEEFDQQYLDGSDLVIGMNGRPIKNIWLKLKRN